MLSWIIIAIVVYAVGLFIPALILMSQTGVLYLAGPRDEPVAETKLLGRARRAHENFKESLPVFLALAILTLMMGEGPTSLALTGAAIFVIARIVYVPLYLGGIHFARTVVWTASCVGLICMAVSLF